MSTPLTDRKKKDFMRKRRRQREISPSQPLKKVLRPALHREKIYIPVKLLQIEDQRKQFERNAKKVDGTPAKITDRRYQSKVRRGFFYHKIGFADPKNVVICRRRMARRKTLFAKKKIGKGKGSSRKRRYTEYSKVRC